MKNEAYLIPSSTGRALYAATKDLPIYDYHCHLSPKAIFEDEPCTNLSELWLSGDHYKWRLMRAAGIEERLITGDASWEDKFRAYAFAVETAAGSPLYHWTRMELEQFFGITTPLNPETADGILAEANRVLKDKALSPRKLILSSGGRYIGTTDDPADPLTWHERIAATDFPVKVAPSFRTDKMILCRDPQYGAYLERLGEAAGVAITDLDSLEQAVELRLDAFVACGCKFTDVGIPFFPNRIADREEAAASFAKVQAKKPLTDEEYQGFVGYLYVFLGRAYAKRNLVMQLHLGVMRNVNGPLFAAVGPDAGGDCTGDPIPGVDLARILGAIEEQGGLPETILYCLNPSMAQQLAAIAGSFRRVRSGAAWWFCDHKRGIEEQLNVVAEVGHLGRFLGMLTDSRSFLSYARHDYFRRILCNLLGQWVDADELELSAAEKVARGVCSENIRALIEE